MSNTEHASIQFLNFIVKESHIVFNSADNYKIDISLNPKGTINKSINQFVLQISLTVKDLNNGFNVNMLTESFFGYSSNVDIDKQIDLFSLNAPAIIFPYIRAYISGLTALSGMATLTLPTLNLSQLGEKLKESITVID